MRLRLQVFVLASAICVFLGVYSLLIRRSHHATEILRLEHEYLDWDFVDTPEEITCQQGGNNTDKWSQIPFVAHFVLIAEHDRGAELEFYQYLAIKAALLRIQPERIKVHTYALNEENEWWQLIQHRVELVIHTRRETLITTDGVIHKLRLPHQTDILRLEVLHSRGGIYLDTDVYALQSFSPLLTSSRDVLMGYEGGSRSGLGNAVIVARPASTFISRWLEAYRKSFDDRPQMWNHHSVMVPAQLAHEFPDTICTLSPAAFFWPTWSREHIESMHQPLSVDASDLAEIKSNISQWQGAMYPNQLAYHAWGNLARERFLRQLTPDTLLNVDTKFNILLREVYETSV